MGVEHRRAWLPQVDRLAMVCAERGVHVAIGINEREDERPGSLYNTLLVIGGDGVLHRHRKLMPTMTKACPMASVPVTISVWSSFPETPGWVA